MLFGMILLIADLLVEDKKWLGFIALVGIAFPAFFLFRLRGIQTVGLRRRAGHRSVFRGSSS